MESVPVFGELYRKGSLNVQVSALHDRGKVIHHFNRRILESYNLTTDQGEQVRLPETAEPTASRIQMLAKWLNRRWRTFDDRLRADGISEVQLDEKTADMLRSLGYTD
jgi:hypothetical protein